MMAYLKRYSALVIFLACLGCGSLLAQQTATTASSEAQAVPSSQQAQGTAAQAQRPENPNSAIGGELASESREAAGEENAQFKYSASVRWFARHLGMNERQMYWVSLVVNFGLLGLFFWYLFRSKLPQAFRDRTATIQKGIKDAQAASADASRRLSEIEKRLGKLDAEVEEIRTSAERDTAAEEQRIKLAAEEDRQKIVHAAESEIDAIARNARRELKGYAASLAIDLAAKQIRVDDATDHNLVREFVDHLGKDGK
jgi:F-type H+-transporting ATPase subunit b